MELTRQQKHFKYLIYCLLILGADLMQNVTGLFPEICGARCFILLPVVIAIAMSEDILSATFLGFFAGLLWDMTSSVHMGFNMIIITLLCFGISAFTTHIARDTFITTILCTTVSVILYGIVYWLCFIIIKGVNDGESTLFTFYIPCMLYTIVLTPLIWLVMDKIKQRLNHIQKQDF